MISGILCLQGPKGIEGRIGMKGDKGERVRFDHVSFLK